MAELTNALRFTANAGESRFQDTVRVLNKCRGSLHCCCTMSTQRPEHPFISGARAVCMSVVELFKNPGGQVYEKGRTTSSKPAGPECGAAGQQKRADLSHMQAVPHWPHPCWVTLRQLHKPELQHTTLASAHLHRHKRFL